MPMDENTQPEPTSAQPTTPRVSSIPPLPAWPRSQPGAMVTEPPPGTRRVAARTEQVVVLDYDQERGRHASNQ